MEDYNNYKLFRWNTNNILFHNNTNVYNDVYLHTGSIIKGQWENCVCFTYINNEINIISNSNNFIHGHAWGVKYNSTYKIFDNIVRNYKEIIDCNKIKYDLDPEKTYFYMLGAFCFSNSGHDLSILIDYVNYIITNKITDIIIFKNYKNTNNFKLLTLLIPKNCNFIELDELKIYKIKSIIIIQPMFYQILHHQKLITDLIEKVTETYAIKYSHLHNKNLILMKTNRNKNVLLEHTRLHCEKMLTVLEDSNYIVLIPEEMDVFELCIYLLFCNKVVISSGSVIYTNKIFINNHAKKIGFMHISTNTNQDMNNISNLEIIKYNSSYFTDDECINYAKKILEY